MGKILLFFFLNQWQPQQKIHCEVWNLITGTCRKISGKTCWWRLQTEVCRVCWLYTEKGGGHSASWLKKAAEDLMARASARQSCKVSQVSDHQPKRWDSRYSLQMAVAEADLAVDSCFSAGDWSTSAGSFNENMMLKNGNRKSVSEWRVLESLEKSILSICFLTIIFTVYISSL